MKNKLIKIILLSILMILCVLGTTKILALSGGSDVAQGGYFATTYCSEASSGYCYTRNPTRGVDHEIQGLRISVVDSNGNLVSERAIDIVNDRRILVNTSASDWELTKLNLTRARNDKPISLGASANSKYIRNQVLDFGSNTATHLAKEESVYYWSRLPQVLDHVADLRAFFIDVYNNDFGTLQKIFSLIGYANNGAATKQQIANDNYYNGHYLLIEPLQYLQYHQYGQPAAYAFYGTGTEVYRMAVDNGLTPRPELFKQRYPMSIHVVDEVRDGINQTSTAGLASVEHITPAGNNWAPYMLTYNGTKYGVASGHFWIKDFGEVTHTCQAGDPSCVCYSSGLVSSLSADCAVANNGYAKDTDDWACIYRQKNEDKDTYAGQFYQEINNPYCTIACREEISYSFPQDIAQKVSAGFRFTIGIPSTVTVTDPETGEQKTVQVENENVVSLSPIVFTGVKTCKTGVYDDVADFSTLTDSQVENKVKINYTKFETDYKAADRNMRNAWIQYQIQVAYSKSKAGGLTKGTVGTVHQHTTTSVTPGTCSYTFEACDANGCRTGGDTCTSGSNISEICSAHRRNHCIEADGTDRCTVGSPNSFTCTDTSESGTSVYEHTSPTYTTYVYSGRPVTYNGHTYVYKEEKADCGHLNVLTPFNLSGEYNENAGWNENHTVYNAAQAFEQQSPLWKYNYYKNLRDSIYNQIQECNNYVNLYPEFSPELTFSYSDPVYGNSPFPLIREVDSIKVISTYSDGNYDRSSSVSGSSMTDTYTLQKGTIGTIQSSTCSGDLTVCNTRTTITYSKNPSITSTTTVSYKYRIGSDIYRYVDKDGLSFSSREEYIRKIKVSKDFGYSVFPVTYRTSSGTFQFAIDYSRDAEGNETLFGKEQKYLKYKDDPAIVGKVTPAHMVDITAPDYLCRFEVENCITKNCPGDTDGLNVIYRPISLTNPFPDITGDGRHPGANWSGDGVKEKYITNNRGVNTYEVYNMKPMYQFIINSANIRAIRSYNKSHDFNDFELECIEGLYCKSKFLQEGENKYFKFTNENPTGGECFNANRTDWESCRYVTIEE